MVPTSFIITVLLFANVTCTMISLEIGDDTPYKVFSTDQASFLENVIQAEVDYFDWTVHIQFWKRNFCFRNEMKYFEKLKFFRNEKSFWKQNASYLKQYSNYAFTVIKH